MNASELESITSPAERAAAGVTDEEFYRQYLSAEAVRFVNQPLTDFSRKAESVKRRARNSKANRGNTFEVSVGAEEA